MISTLRLLALLSALAAFALLGCGGSDDSGAGDAADATPAAVPQADAGRAARPAAGRKDPQIRGQLPANFPQDVPVHSEANVEFSRVANDMALAARFTAQGSVADVAEFYADEFAAKGWSTETRETPEGTLIIADKSTRKAVATVTEGPEGGSQVDVLVTELPR